jgi:hypothetical protein
VGDWVPDVDGRFLGETTTPRRWDGSKLINISHSQLANVLPDQHADTKVRSKVVDETNIGDGKVLVYRAASDTLQYETPAGGVTPRLMLAIWKYSGAFWDNTVLSGSGGTLASVYYRLSGSTTSLTPVTVSEARRFYLNQAHRLKAALKYVRFRGYYQNTGGYVDAATIQLKINKVAIDGTRTNIWTGTAQALTTTPTNYEQAVNVNVTEDETLELEVYLSFTHYSANGTSTTDLYCISPRIIMDAN